MGDLGRDGRDRSRSPGSGTGRLDDHDEHTWNEAKQMLYDAITSRVPSADDDLVCATIDVLHEHGVKNEDQLKNMLVRQIGRFFSDWQLY